MYRTIALLSLALAVVALAMPSATSAPETRFPADAGALVTKMGADQIVEMGVRKDGSLDQIEFHVPFSEFPEAVRAALEKALPGGEVLDAEVEFSGGARQYEVTKKVDGLEAEVLVDEKGNVISWELQVAAEKVPAAVVKAGDAATGGKITQWEEIRDGERELLAYHMKKDENGIKWKVAISPEGTVTEVRREMKAEIEVTVR